MKIEKAPYGAFFIGNARAGVLPRRAYGGRVGLIVNPIQVVNGHVGIYLGR